MSDFKIVSKKANVDPCWGLETFYITKEEIDALLSGKKLYSTVNCDEYAITIEMEEKEFHCGIEESGGHAYNCNDCPNKCEEWYQWDKETKNDRLY